MTARIFVVLATLIVGLLAVIALIVGCLGVWNVSTAEVKASGTTTRFDGTTPAEVAVDVAREVAAGPLSNLSHILVAADEGLVDAALSLSKLGWHSCPGGEA